PSRAPLAGTGRVREATDRCQERVPCGDVLRPLERRRPEQVDTRDRTGRAAETRVLAPEAGPEVEPARAGRRVEVARRVAVDADLLPHREPVPREGRRAHLERPLEAAVARDRAATRDAQRRWQQLAVGRAAVAGRAVGRTVVALLAAVDGAVPALEAAGGRAAVARRGITVVARLAELLDAVAADGRVRLAGERHRVAPHAVPRRARRPAVHHAARDQTRQVWDHEREERGADIARGDRHTALQDRRARL